jgi:DNA polymerase I-like protein with 3'-5' exonuclease and polymerase domains
VEEENMIKLFLNNEDIQNQLLKVFDVPLEEVTEQRSHAKTVEFQDYI